MRVFLLLVICGAVACAAGRPAGHAAQPTTAAESGGGSSGALPNEPEVVSTGKSFKLSYSDASSRYNKGARCGGDDAPEAVIGPPDQRNEMQQAKAKLVTYGYRFREGTLLIRCRADHVEVQRTLK
jgi:hypothetical protein